MIDLKELLKDLKEKTSSLQTKYDAILTNRTNSNNNINQCNVQLKFLNSERRKLERLMESFNTVNNNYTSNLEKKLQKKQELKLLSNYSFSNLKDYISKDKISILDNALEEMTASEESLRIFFDTLINEIIQSITDLRKSKKSSESFLDALENQEKDILNEYTYLTEHFNDLINAELNQITDSVNSFQESSSRLHKLEERLNQAKQASNDEKISSESDSILQLETEISLLKKSLSEFDREKLSNEWDQL